MTVRDDSSGDAYVKAQDGTYTLTVEHCSSTGHCQACVTTEAAECCACKAKLTKETISSDPIQDLGQERPTGQ